MGVGDWILASADARELHEKNGLKAVFAKPDHSEHYWHEIFDGVSFIERHPKDGQAYNVICNYQGNRPYFLGCKHHKVQWNPEFKARPGMIVLSQDERAYALSVKAPLVVVEPNVDTKYSYAVNKDWGFAKWQTLVSRNKHIPWVQFDYGSKRLAGVRHVQTTFRQACAVLDRALFLVATDGGLHHAAAALGKPAVVLWGGFVGPDLLGYGTHSNMRAKGVESCGQMKFCGHCRRAMKALTVEEVEAEVNRLYAFCQVSSGVTQCCELSRRVAAHV